MTLPAAPSGWSLILDVSQFNGRIRDVDALMAAGVRALSIRAVDGEHDTDTEAAHTASSCALAGLPYQVYGVIENYGPKRAAAQAVRLASAHRDLGAWLAPAMDLELPVHPERLTPDGARACVAAARVYVETVAEQLGARPFCYTSAYFLDTLQRIAGPSSAPDLEAIARCEGWIADYGSGTRALTPFTYTPSVPKAYRNHNVRLWQAGPFGARLPWPGGGPVDVDWFRGDVAEMVTSAGASPAQRA